MKKASAKEIIERIKKKRLGSEKSNFTYRLNAELMSRFNVKCERVGIKPTYILEELIEDFLRGD
jgi:hypothetical protein